MVRLCGKLGSRVCGLLGSVCGSVGLAVLVVALAALATRHAYAEDPIENCVCLPSETPEECLARCGEVGFVRTCWYSTNNCIERTCWTYDYCVYDSNIARCICID